MTFLSNNMDINEKHMLFMSCNKKKAKIFNVSQAYLLLQVIR